jgi:hypothetical protein
MARNREMSAEVRRALDERWPRVYEDARAQIAVIEAFVTAGAAATTTQQRAAVHAAHQLSGRLGMFARHEASSVAAGIEVLLAIDADAEGTTRLTPPSQRDLRILVDRLDGLIML